MVENLSLTVAGASDAALSLFSVFNVLEASGAARDMVAERFGDLFGTEFAGGGADVVVDDSFLRVGEPVFSPTDGALELIVEPSDRYLELVTAIAGDGHASRDADLHGWPILSLVTANASVTKPGGESIAARGGAA